MGFQIQVRSIQWDIWVVPDTASRWWVKGRPMRSSSVAELRQTIRKTADEWDLSFPLALRIVTDRGEPVERWSVWAGRAKRLRRRY